MLYNAYRDNVVYSSQSMISFPRSGNGERDGFGSMLFLMCPNRKKGIECIQDPIMSFIPSLTKRLLTDTIYRDKIGTKSVVSLERMQTDKIYLAEKEFKLMYVPTSARNSFLNKKYNMVNDLSRWMELFFLNSDQLDPRRKCSEFIRILRDRLEDSSYKNYEKLLIFDVNSWAASIRSCVIMNRKLLNNPFSIILYTACYFPEMLKGMPNIRIMVLNRAAGQVYFIKLADITKSSYPRIKSKLNGFKSLVFSVEDDIAPSNNNVDAEVNAEVINSIKEELKTKLKYNLLGDNTGNPFDSILDDITSQVAEPLDEEFDSLIDIDKELKDAKNNSPLKEKELSFIPNTSDNTDLNEDSSDFDLDSEINKLVDDEFMDTDMSEDPDQYDIDAVSVRLADKLRDAKYKATFIPEYTEEEKERIARLTKNQSEVLPAPTLDDVQRKSITKSVVGGFIQTTNPNILESKFVNFDNDYAKKCLEKNIDDSVKILSNASSKIFVVGKDVTDSSTPMDLKMTYTYKLEDEKGNKMSITFDIPKIIDKNYIYLNGTKKSIRHQFILKPIVKTSPDVVQLVTAYNKVFIYRRGILNQNMNRIITFIEKSGGRFNEKVGNCSMINSDYEVPLDFSMISRYYNEITINNKIFYMSINAAIANYKKITGKELVFDKNKEIPIGFDKKTKSAIILPLDESYTEYLYNQFNEEDKKSIGKIKRKPKFVAAKAKIMGQDLPVVLFMMYCEGFASVMKKANIKYQFIEKKDLKKFDTMIYDSIEMANGYIIWEKMPFRNELIMNGFKGCDLTDFTYDELESKDLFTSLIIPMYPGKSKISEALDNYKDFLIDEKTKEILIDLGYPTDLVSLLIISAGMLSDNKYKIENDMHNMRIRSTEVISDIVYSIVTRAYNDYRSTAYKSKPNKLKIKKSAVIDTLLSSDTNMIEEFSTLNPMLEIEKQRSVTFKGMRGIQKDRALTLPRRAYTKSMLGIVGITTSPDANVGVVKQLTLEPNITSTYGYLDADKGENVDNLNAANLFTATELLHPLGVTHDDPDRTSMSIKQAKATVPIQDADPVLIGNKVEAIMPYLLSDEFVVTAKNDGKVIAIENQYVIVEYKDGIKYAIDISDRVRKNSSAGFWIDNTLTCDLKVGDKFKKGDVLAYNSKHFTKHSYDNGASMNLGALCKIAISSQWDVFEDSAPISKRLSDKLTTEMVDEKEVTVSPYTFIDHIVNVGDSIKAGDPLLIFSDAETDEYQKLFDNMREENKQAVIESAKTTISSKYTGEVVDIKIYTTVPVEELHPSLRKIVTKYQKRISARNETLSKYSNKDDMNYFKAGQVIYEVAETIDISKNNKVKGYMMEDDGVLILFYIKYKVAASKGDKVVVSVCKGIASHVIEEGMEPYSELRPDEPIDTVVAPLAVAARKVPAIFLTIFGNKLLIELKRQLADMYLENK